jgi:hypothetical protein
MLDLRDQGVIRLLRRWRRAGIDQHIARADGVSDIIIAVAAATPNERMINCLKRACLKPGPVVRL